MVFPCIPAFLDLPGAVPGYPFANMNRFQARRATVEDLPQLRTLWEMENLPGEALEKRFTEFQIVDDGAGQVLAATGLQLLEGHGRIHSEAFAFEEEAEAMRALLWPRLETLARNQGLARLWTSLAAPFWKGVGFKKVTEQTLPLLPPAFAEEDAAWLTMPLRAGGAGADEIDKLFAELKVVSQADQERLTARAKKMKVLAMILMVLVFAAFFVWVVMFTYYKRRH